MEYFIKDAWIRVNISNSTEYTTIFCHAMNIDNTLYLVAGTEFLHLDIETYPIIRRAQTHMFIVHKKGEILEDFNKEYFTFAFLAGCINSLYECHPQL